VEMGSMAMVIVMVIKEEMRWVVMEMEMEMGHC
jgi:hypothetical protein